MVMDDLQQIMLGILKHHEDTLVFQDNLDQLDYIGMAEFGAQGHLSDSGLRYSSILDLLAFLVCALISHVRRSGG